MIRNLLEKGNNVFIRFNESISIYRKVYTFKEKSFSDSISSRKPFGLTTNTKGAVIKANGSILMYSFPKNSYIKEDLISINKRWIQEHKVYISYAYGERGSFPYLIIGKPFYGAPGTCCSETYLVIGPFHSKQTCESIMTYMRTKFFRFLVLLRKNTQHATGKVYQFVPMQDFSETWTDEKLYKKYGLTKDEIAFIDSMIRPMNLSQIEDDDE